MPLAPARPIVLALPRGGVPVAAEVARALGAPLEVLVVRKIGAPQQPELGIGAVAENGVVWVDGVICQAIGVDEDAVDALAAQTREAVEAAIERLRGERPLLELAGRLVVIVDDGLATGSTARAAIAAVKLQKPARVVFAAPVAAAQTAARLRDEVDAVVAVTEPTQMAAVGQWYHDFSQVDDEEVRALLAASAEATAPTVATASAAATNDAVAALGRDTSTVSQRQIEIALDDGMLGGDLMLPTQPRGLIVFAHGSGSGRRSPRNRFVADALVDAGFATLLFDLLTGREQVDDAATGRLRFDIPRLAGRLVAVIDGLATQPELAALPLGCFGASTGAAAALIAAAARPDRVAAVVSRGGRVDLAGPLLPDVRAPTLLLVGGDDESVLALNQEGLAELGGEKDLVVIAGASHLFEEPGALVEVARLAASWFSRALEVRRGEARP
jgi:putative phosphoribosyl transferase